MLDGQDAEENVRRILSLDDRYRIVGILSLGVPAETKEPNKPESLDFEKVHEI